MSNSPSPTLDAMSREYILRNAYRVLRRKQSFRGHSLWILVMEVTGYGSTSSTLICKELGWDPDMPVGKDLPVPVPR